MTRQSLRLNLVAGVASLLATFALSSSASAACCVAYDYQDAANNKNQVISQLTDRINAMQLAIIEAMRLGTGQLSGNLKEQIGANSNVANVQDDRNVTSHVEQARLDAIASAASGASSCNVITGANAAANLPAAVKSYSVQNTQSLLDWDVGSNPSLPSSQGQDVAVESRIQRHCQYYANQDDVNSGLCQSVASTMMNASIDASRSIYYSNGSSDGETLDSDHLDAAKTFVVNSIDPRPQGAALNGDAKLPGGRQRAADKHSNAARMSLAMDAASDAIARRTALSSSDAASWASSMAAQTGQQVSSSAASNTSLYDWMGIRAKGWFFNSNWATAADAQSYQQATKDMAMMMSFQVYMQWEQYKLQEKQNLLIAALLAITNQNSRPRGTSAQ